MRCGRLSEIPHTRIHCVAQLLGLIVAATLLLVSPAAALPAAAGASALENPQVALKGFAYDSSSTATTPSLERRPTCCEVNGRARVRPGGGRHPLRVPSLATRGITRSIDDLPSLRGATSAEVDDLARQAGFTVRTGTRRNPSVTYYRPGTNESVGFRVVPEGVVGQPGVKSGPYLRRFGNPVDEPLRIPLAGNPGL